MGAGTIRVAYPPTFQNHFTPTPPTHTLFVSQTKAKTCAHHTPFTVLWLMGVISGDMDISYVKKNKN